MLIIRSVSFCIYTSVYSWWRPSLQNHVVLNHFNPISFFCDIYFSLASKFFFRVFKTLSTKSQLHIKFVIHELSVCGVKIIFSNITFHDKYSWHYLCTDWLCTMISFQLFSIFSYYSVNNSIFFLLNHNGIRQKLKAQFWRHTQ